MDQPNICRKSLWDTKMNEEVDLARTILDHKKVQVETAELVIRRREKVDRQRANPANLHTHASHAAAKTARTRSRERANRNASTARDAGVDLGSSSHAVDRASRQILKILIV